MAASFDAASFCGAKVVLFFIQHVTILCKKVVELFKRCPKRYICNIFFGQTLFLLYICSIEKPSIMYINRLTLCLLIGLLLSACNVESPCGQTSEAPADLQISSSLSNQRISSIAQDSLGYVWMGTYRGLNRFNGHEMQQFFCDDQPHSIPDNQVWGVFTDRQGRVWVGTKNGVAYYTEREGFCPVSTPDLSRISTAFAQNRGGDIFLLQADQVLRYDSLHHSFESVIQGLGYTSYLNNNMYVDDDDKLWVVCEGRVSCYSSYTYSRHDMIDCSGWTITRSCLYGDELWLSHQNELRIYDVMRHQWLEVPDVFGRHPAFRTAYVECMQPMPQGKMLIGTRVGMFEYDPVTQTLLHQSEAAFPFEAPQFVVSHIFCDDKPNLWLCSESQGYEIRTQNTRRFNSDNYLRSAFSGIPVASVALDGRQNLWVATQTQGLYSYDLLTHAICHYDLPDPEARLQGEQLRIYAILVDSQGDVWVTCTPNGVMQLHPQGKALKLVHSYNLPMPIAINEDMEGTLWVGSYSNSYYSHRQGDAHFEEHRILSNIPSYTSCIKTLADGRTAALTKSQGLRFVDSERLEMLPSVFPDSLLNACITRSTFLPTSMLQDKSGDLWIGTVSNGLLHYDIQQGALRSVSGAACEDISSIEQSLDGNLWISTQYGLSKLDTETMEFTSYYEADGIGGNEFYDRCSCRLPDGTLVFGGAHGLTVFNPADLHEDLSPRLYFENLKVDNRLVRPWQGKSIDQSMHTATKVNLDYNQTNFSLSFAVLDYSGSERYDYQYMLEGFNTQWVEANSSREAFYANLSPGCYTFRVRATSKDQHRIIAERSLPIHIAPAPWATWWAWVAYLVLAAGVLAYIIRLMLRNRAERKTRLLSEREKEHERRINRMNMSFFANVSHEFRTPLTVISAPIKQLIAENEEAGTRSEELKLLRIVQRSVNRMLRLVNQMMDFHKLEDDALRLEVRRQDIIQVLGQTAEVFRLQAAEKKIELHTYGLEDNFLLWIDSDKVEKIIYNLLGNAIKYTPSGGRIDLTFDATPQQVHFSVADTGQGIPEDQQSKIFERYYQLHRQEQGQFNWGTGIGLYYAQKLAQLHHGSISVENRQEGTGAIFTVTLPANESAYSDEEKTTLKTSQTALYPLDSPNAHPTEDPNSSNPSNPTLPTVLVIDDDVEIVHYIKTLLSTRYQVIGRFDADTGLEVLQQKAPDIILCDVMMPGRDGFDFCRQVKNDLQLCHIPVVLLTAKTATSDMVQGLGTGADAYVSKPFDPAYLSALIDSILKNREKVQHLLSANTQTEAIEDDVLSPQDRAFMTELYNIMEQELANPDLDVSHITEMLHVSRSKLYYKIKGLTGENPSIFFRQYKLNRAAEMIREGKYNISEISLLTGFSTLSHFSTSFKRHFGVTPSEFQ